MKSINILLVEDNDGDIILTQDALSLGMINCHTSVVKDGWEALQYIWKQGKYENVQAPDLILLDINLPKMNGHEVLHRLKENLHTRHIPVIMLTTSSSDIDIQSAYLNYANCYITKPVDADDYTGVILSIENFWGSIAQLPGSYKN
ncbi:MAG: response regulator [Bacteroidetes bacterium]|nr:response regulator [Bacteroidota bacterium]